MYIRERIDDKLINNQYRLIAFVKIQVVRFKKLIYLSILM